MILRHLLVALLLISSLLSHAASNHTRDTGSVSLDVKQYSELGRFGVPRGMTLNVVKFNGKTFILSGMPDRRLYDITLGRSKDGREIVCGQISTGLKVPVCYYVFFREK